MSMSMSGVSSLDPKNKSRSVSRRKVPEIHYIDDPKNSSLPRIKLNTSAVEKNLVNRLLNPPSWITKRRNMEEITTVAYEERPLSPRAFKYKTLSSTELDENVERMYTAGMKRSADTRARLTAKYNQEETELKVLSPEEMEESVERLYTEDMDKRADSKQALHAKYYPEDEEVRTLAYDEVEDCARRCCNEAAEHRLQTIASLEKQYTFHPKKSKKLDPEAVRAMAERLSKPNPHHLVQQ